MKNSTELRGVVASVLLTQIQFGVYHNGEKLPNIEETSDQLCVSIDTARAAYLRLKEEGYITLSKNVGATVKVDYSPQETEGFIQTFFSLRRNAMIDLSKSMGALFGNAQLCGLKHASGDTLREMEQLYRENNKPVPYSMLEHLNQKYSALGNTLLMRLVWQTFTFLHAPYFSITENLQYFDKSADYLPKVLSLCCNQDWTALRGELDQSIERLSLALTRFYAARITGPTAEKEITFSWSSYKKSRQLCYSLAMELLISISRGLYPAGSLLPSQKELAAEKGVSVSTVRRALGLLDSVGAIKSAKYMGTAVLPLDKATENSDFTKPVLQRRLMDMAESLQIFALSCKDVACLTFSSFDSGSLQELCGKLKIHKQWKRGETLSYFILNLITEHAPYQAIRTVYSELLRQFFWAYALLGVNESQESVNAMYDPYFDMLIDSLEKQDLPRFSASLEVFLLFELRKTVGSLIRLGIPGAESILIPDNA